MWVFLPHNAVGFGKNWVSYTGGNLPIDLKMSRVLPRFWVLGTSVQLLQYWTFVLERTLYDMFKTVFKDWKILVYSGHFGLILVISEKAPNQSWTSYEHTYSITFCLLEIFLSVCVWQKTGHRMSVPTKSVFEITPHAFPRFRDIWIAHHQSLLGMIFLVDWLLYWVA